VHSGSAQDRIARLKTRIAGLKTAGELSSGPRHKTAKPTSALKTPVRCKTRPESPSAAHGHRAPLSEVGYRPRKPESSVIHRVIAENLSSFLDQAEQASKGQHFPAFVIDELKGLVSCGDYRQGFALFRCGECNTALALPFSCKSRVCPSCAAKRMTSLSAHLTDNVIPFVPVRQWVWSFPVWLRYKIGYDHDLYREVIGRFDRHVCSFYRQQAEAEQRIHGNDRRQLERTLRCCLRGPLSEQRLSILDDGKVQVAVKKI
jgi:hypothetical protein